MRTLLPVLTLLLLQGCAFSTLREEVEAFSTQVSLSGHVVSAQERTRGPVFVVAYRSGAAADYRVLRRPGAFGLLLPQGEYRVAAFEDINENGTYDAGEPAGEAGPSDSNDALLIRIEAGGRLKLPFSQQAMPGTGRRQTFADLDPLAYLETPDFAAENGRKGMWEPLRFLRELRGGVYLLEPYDPDRIPVLFVHGAGGTPQDWRYFIDRLDRTRYQAWVYYYPTALPLEFTARSLNKSVSALREEYGFLHLVVTAHSMGGLVARRFVQLNASSGCHCVSTLITLATPFGGVGLAGLGARHMPFPMPSWLDLVPGSGFLATLHATPLPASATHHVMAASEDWLVPFDSQLGVNANAVHVFQEGHGGILVSAAVFDRYEQLLANPHRVPAPERDPFFMDAVAEALPDADPAPAARRESEIALGHPAAR